MKVRVRLGYDDDAATVELDYVPRKGERILNDGELYEVRSVVYRLDEPVEVFVVASEATQEVWFR